VCTHFKGIEPGASLRVTNFKINFSTELETHAVVYFLLALGME
jgi:hypothetical protein